MENGQITFWRAREEVSRFLREWKGGFGSPEVWKTDIPVSDRGEEHRGITKNWVDAIRRGTPLLAPGTEGIRGVELANAMQLSAWTDDWVDIPVDEELFHAKLQERIAGSKGKKEGSAGQPLEVEGSFQ